MRKTAIVIWAALALLCPTALAQTASVDELLAQTAKWQSDTSRQPLLAVSQMVLKARGSAPQTREMEQRFIAFLKSDATLAGKDFICKQLSLMGSEASVPVLSGMLLDPKTADMGRYALERIPGPAVDRALREALVKSTGKTRIGIVNTLGQRGDAASVAALRPLAMGPQPEEAAAALFALAKIADPAAIEVLAEAQGKTTGAVRASAAAAWLQAANRLTEHGNAAAALPIYRKLYAAGDQGTERGTVRAAALRGLATAGGAQAVPVLMEALRGDDARLQAVAIGALAQSSASQLMAEIPRLNEAGQVRALGVLAERGDAAALPSFTAALKSTSKAVRIAGLDGIGRMGDASAVAAVAGLAAGGDASEQTAARASLVRIHGNDADRAVSDGILSAETKVKLELIRAAGERGTAAAAPSLLKMARDPDDEVRRASLRALRDTGSANEISGLVELVAKPVQAGDRTDTVRSLAAVLRRSDPARIDDVVAAYTPSRDMETRASLMQVMGQSGNAKALPILRAGLQDQDAEVKRAAILALTDWPDGAPIPDLMNTARTASTPAHQVLALRGALRLVGLPGTHGTPGENVQVLAEVMSLAKQPEEKRAVLALLIRFPTKEALELASASVNDSAVSAEAKAAVARLQRTVRR